MRMSDAIVATAHAHPDLNLLQTETLSYQVTGVSNARDKIHGTFNPHSASFDFSTPRATLSAIFVQRYGHGFGLPYKLSDDPNEGGFQPDGENRNYGWEEEENLPLPSASTLKQLGFPDGYQLSSDGMDRTDMQACVRFTELVIRPLNAGRPIGTQMGGLVGMGGRTPSVPVGAVSAPVVAPKTPPVAAPPALPSTPSGVLVATPPIVASPAPTSPDLATILGVLAATGGIAGTAAAPAPTPTPAPAPLSPLFAQLTQLLQMYAMLKSLGLVK